MVYGHVLNQLTRPVAQMGHDATVSRPAKKAASCVDRGSIANSPLSFLLPFPALWYSRELLIQIQPEIGCPRSLYHVVLI